MVPAHVFKHLLLSAGDTWKESQWPMQRHPAGSDPYLNENIVPDRWEPFFFFLFGGVLELAEYEALWENIFPPIWSYLGLSKLS